FANRRVTTGQIILFGLTGGLIPCPASITVLLLCLQVGRIGLGALLVLCFSVGLALTLVLVGVAAALGLRHAASCWPGFEAFAARAPYFSGAIVAAIGAYTIASGAAALA
ncbi:MAG: nickel/cobalt efflux protein RcnA, partial [Alphaproteobacteria bacterium]|nr:nickel/cobalt efflux protein RcnA [Alphaproteobacteria bacterium]